MRRTLLLAALPLAAAAAAAQEGHHHAGPPGKVGRVDFPTSCRPAAQSELEQGAALLHSFWYEKAGEAFARAAAADSACAMAYWGQATSILHPLWWPPSRDELARGLALAERAVSAPTATPRERAWAEAIAAFYRDHQSRSHAERMAAYERRLEELHQAHPRDDEAAMFYALALVANASPTDTAFTRQRRAGAILEPLVDRYPDHPGLVHYIIHAYDSPALADRAIAAARRYTDIAPSVPHARHMPSHIFTRRGMWEESIRSNLSSAEAARQFEVEQRSDGVWDQRLHALDYLVYAHLQLGQDAAARRLVDETAAVTRTFPANALTTEYALAAAPARYAVERGRWREAAALAPRPSSAFPATAAIRHFARAIGAARSGDTAAARVDVAALAVIEEGLARQRQALWLNAVRAQRLAASAWLARAAGDTSQALRLAEEAAALEDTTEKHPVTPGALLPARELQGDLLLELGRAREARRAYEASLVRAPRRARSLHGALVAAERSGDQAAAAKYRRALRELLAKADPTADRPEVAAARRGGV